MEFTFFFLLPNILLMQLQKSSTVPCLLFSRGKSEYSICWFNQYLLPSFLCTLFFDAKSHILIASQNQRTLEAGRGFWRCSTPRPLLKAGSAGTGYSGLRPVRFWRSPRTETTKSPWATCASIWSPTQQTQFFLVLKLNFLHFSLCSLGLSLDSTEKTLALSSLHPPIRYLHMLIRSPPQIQGEQSQRSQPLLIWNTLQSLTTTVVLHWTCSSRPMTFLHWGVLHWTHHSRRGIISDE